MSRNTYADIDLLALHANLDKLQSHAPNSRNLAVVKANAYGHGALEVSKSIEAYVDMFAVAFIDEARELKEGGITKPILILQGPHQASDLDETMHLNLHWMMHNETQLDWLKASENTQSMQDISARLWIKFDTGMHRLGFDIASFEHVLSKYKSLIGKDTVIASHLACADEENETHAQTQIQRFQTNSK